MSFDLYFCIRSGETFDASPVYEHFASNPSFQMHGSPETSFQAWYQNKATGVYCSFDFEEIAKNPEDAPPLAQGFLATGLTFNLNYFRPSFFAHETMPKVEQVASGFNLLVLDPQESREEIETPHNCVAAELVASWEKNNERGVSSALTTKGIGKTEYVYYPRDRSLEWWNYAKEKEKLQTDLGGDVFVPTIFLMQKGRDPRLRSVVSWADAIPQVFPPCDDVVKQVMKKNWLGKIGTKQMQVLPFDSVLSALSHIAQSFDQSIPNLIMLPPHRSAEIKKAFDQLAGPVFEPQEYKTLASDRFVDVLVPERLTPGK